jgi:5-oxoprolinase (ATP-hydrolysing) subunit A
MTPRAIDLNADVGEGMPTDAALVPLVSSVNIACGAHAGDVATMRATVQLAMAHAVAIGAHPGFDDRASFGRVEHTLTSDALAHTVRVQIDALRAIAASEGTRVTHVKPHGALYNMAARDERMAECIARTIHAIDPTLILVGLAGSVSIRAAEALGLRTAAEAFADRTYRADGTLTPRARPDAMHLTQAAAVAQVQQLLADGTIHTVDRTTVHVTADTICLHGDGPHAVEFARALRGMLVQRGHTIRPFTNA